MGIRVMSRRPFLAGMCALGASIVAMEPLASCSRLPIRVAPRPPPIRLGFLGPADPHTEHGWFSQALQKLNDRECRSYDIDYERPSDASSYVAQATQLVRRRPAVILTQGEAATAAAINVTGTVPIVFSMVDDPVEKGFVASLAHPGGNATGLSNVSDDLVQKRVELARDLVPTAEGLAVLWSPSISGQARLVERVVAAADVQNLGVEEIQVSDQGRLRTELRELDRGYSQVLLVMPVWFFFEERAQIFDAASRNRLPAIYSNVGWVRAGGLVSYDGSLSERATILAQYVDKLLLGVKPADLPVQRQSKFDLVINRRSAQSLGLTIPKSIMVQATEVVEDGDEL
jgi:putative ABC transport system substrate-binding protein